MAFSTLLATAPSEAADPPASPPTIVPQPSSISSTGATRALGATVRITDPGDAGTLDALKSALTKRGVAVSVVGASASDGSDLIRIGPATRSDIAAVLGSQPTAAEGYALKSTSGAVVVGGADAAGTFYGAQTLVQLLRGNAAGTGVVLAAVSDAPRMPLRGTIEGFYGAPWTQQERLDQLAFYGTVKMNTYIYAPKDDVYHRDKWREPYPADKLNELGELVTTATKNHVRFTFALSPGESVCFSSQSDRDALVAKFDALYDLGVRSFSIPLDDISYTSWKCAADATAYGPAGAANAGKAQVSLLNYVQQTWVEKKAGVRPLQMVPTEYSDTAKSAYKREFANLDSDVVIMWTGTDVVPPSITKADAAAAASAWDRKVFLWDNYPVNDFGQTTGRLLMGSYDKRELGLGGSVQGIVSNPMNQASASKPAIAGIAAFSWNDRSYDPATVRSWMLSRWADGDAATLASLEVFADANNAAPTFGPNVWLPQAPQLSALAAAYRQSPTAANLAAIRAYGSRLESAASLVRQQVTDSLFLAEAKPWLDAATFWGSALVKAADAVSAQQDDDFAKSAALAAESLDAVKSARAVVITDKRNTWSATSTPNPRIADGVLDALITDLTKAAGASSENWALNSPEVSASGTEPGTMFVAKNAVDGKATTRWASGYDDASWIKVRLTKEVMVSDIVLSWEAACAEKYLLQVSGDGTTWHDVPVDATTCAIDTVRANTTMPVNYVRMQGVKRATKWAYSLWELSVYGVPTDTPTAVKIAAPTVAAGGKIAASLSGFAPYESVELELVRSAAGTAVVVSTQKLTTSATGRVVAAQIDVADSAAAGEYVLRAKGASSTRSAEATVRITRQPVLTLSSGTVTAGSTVTAQAQGLNPGEQVAFELHSTPVKMGEATADQQGAATLTWRVPAAVRAGAHTVVMTRADGTTVSKALRVTAGPTVTTSPTPIINTPSARPSGGSGLAVTGTNPWLVGGLPVMAGLLLAAGVGLALRARPRQRG